MQVMINIVNSAIIIENLKLYNVINCLDLIKIESKKE